MADRVILHCDLNNFFASVSLLYNPTLKDLPVAVCGSKEERRGIVLAKNEIAKKFGVKTAETISDATRKCPDLVILPPNMELYKEYSHKVREIYSRYTDMVEAFSIDECWLDVTGSTVLFGSGEEIANKIRLAVKRELGITISVGVSFNKVFAKLGSDMKKPDAVTVISRENFKEKVWPLPISDMLFAGAKTCEKLAHSGILTIGDLTLCGDETLKRILGKNGLELKKYALGNDTSAVSGETEVSLPKSVGRSVTERTDFTDYDRVWKTYLTLANEIADTLKKYNLAANGIQIHIRTNALATKEFSKSFDTSTDSALIIAHRGMDLFKEKYDFAVPLRSVGIRAINLVDKNASFQQDIFGNSIKKEKIEMTENAVYSLRKRFGEDSIKSATVLPEKEESGS